MNDYIDFIENKIKKNIDVEKIRILDKSDKHKSHKSFDPHKYHLYLEIESKFLKLNCEKANLILNWYPLLDFEKTISLTANWYKDYYSKKNMVKTTEKQIKEYISLIK